LCTGHPRRDFGIAVVKDDSARIDVADHLADVVDSEGMLDVRMAHAWAGRENHFCLL
jgi:hypothetical protein